MADLTDDDLRVLRDDIRFVKDRIAIQDCVMAQARGHDRHDLFVMASVYHADGVDEHGPVEKAGSDYGEYANAAHESAFADHLHNITTHTCEIDGDVAHSESYVIGSMRAKQGSGVVLLGGRYLDRLEKRDGEWRIALRRCTLEWTMAGDGSMLDSGAFAGFIKGSWGPDDPSYARPLTLDTPAERW